MTTNYNTLRESHKEKYGTDIGRIGLMLLTDRYDERTHFIYELLQNAEDALSRRPKDWDGSHAVRFYLNNDVLYVSHFGQPFNEADVRGVCGIAESTKQKTAIGRFGIGFKSVYAFTDRPEIYSGDEAFAIENFVWPVATAPIHQAPEQTVFRLPLREPSKDRTKIHAGLQHLEHRSLLFLRHIDAIVWDVTGDSSGFFLRSKLVELDHEIGVRRVTLTGKPSENPAFEENWLIFGHDILDEDGNAQRSEIAFLLVQDKESGFWKIKAVDFSPLVVFFPTVIEMHMGFLLQAPFRTTPSRDNVMRDDPWNRRLVAEVAQYLARCVLPWLRDHGLLDTQTLQCLPMNRSRFGIGTLFAPLYDSVRSALLNQPLLPCHPDGFVAGCHAKLSRSQDLRELFDREQLQYLFGDAKAAWLSGDITVDRTFALRSYLMNDLGIPEVTTDLILKLDTPFLSAQADAWILRLYHFLARQLGLTRRLLERPLIRLQNGNHVSPQRYGKPQAFLPGPNPTNFATIRESVCSTEESRKFLTSLGLTEPDPVDDVIYNILPTYKQQRSNIPAQRYQADIGCILKAFATDSKAKRDHLITELCTTPFLRVVNVGTATYGLAPPTKVLLATDRLRALFDGVPGVFFVDTSQECLRGEEVHRLLEACGVPRHIRPIRDEASLSAQEKQKLREQAGHAETSRRNDKVEDWSLDGLQQLLAYLPTLSREQQVLRARLLWEELGQLTDSRNSKIWSGTYRWSHRGNFSTSFDSAFVRMLNRSAWVPDPNGTLQCPEHVLFDSLGWKPDPFLQSKMKFKSPIVEALAREVGIHLDVIDLLKQLNLTDAATLRSRLGLPTESNESKTPARDSAMIALSHQLSTTSNPVVPVQQPVVQRSTSTSTAVPERNPQHSIEHSSGSSTVSVSRARENQSLNHPTTTSVPNVPSMKSNSTTPRSTSTTGRQFISYLTVSHEEEAHDPEGLDYAHRMKLESQAIAFIREREPFLQLQERNNAGFDLFEPDPHGKPLRWVEVKALSVSFQERPATMSHTQLEFALTLGDTYWLYIVEYAGTEKARLIRIQNPAGKAKTFVFDHGWLHVAETDTPVS